MGDTKLELGNRKLVVLGIPWDINTDGLRQYMSKYGNLDDVVVMKERKSGRSRGFGYVTFSSTESAEKALASQHILNGRLLEVKVATPKEDMKTPSRKITRIFVARIPSKVSEEAFRRYFETFGTITDVYMPKDQGANSHRGIGFITYENSESVAKVMSETHELGGSTVAVDEATPKDEGGKSLYKNDHSGKYFDKMNADAYGTFNSYMAASGGSRFGAYGMPSFGPYDHNGPGFASEFGPGAIGSGFGGNGWSGLPTSGRPLSVPGNNRSARLASGGSNATSSVGLENKIFVGSLPSEATADDIRQYFGNFGRILDVYLPKDSKKNGHRGFSFVTFTDKGPAERVCRRSHELLGHQVIVEHATHPDEGGLGGGYLGGNSGIAASGAGASYSGNSYRSSLDRYNGWGNTYGVGGGGVWSAMAGDGGSFSGSRASRMDFRYRPY